MIWVALGIVAYVVLTVFVLALFKGAGAADDAHGAGLL